MLGEDDVLIMMVLMIIPFPATSRVCCRPQTMVLEKIEDKWHVKSTVSGEEVFQYMVQGIYNNYVIMGDTTECYNDPSQRNLILTNLHSYREIILCFRWEEDINSFLRKRLIPCRRLSDFNDVELCEDKKINKNEIIKSKYVLQTLPY